MINILNYLFEGPFSTAAKLHHAPGVYVILCSNANAQGWKILDVGQSENVRDRIEKHDRVDCWRRNAQTTTSPIHCAVHYTGSSPENTRLEIEQKLRDHYNPPCGKR